MSRPLPVAVFGATGAQGGPVARALLAADRPVRALGRNADALAGLAALGAETRSVDLADAAAVVDALRGTAGAFVHLPALADQQALRPWAGTVAAALRAAEVPLTVYTTSGPVPPVPLGIEPFDGKADAERTVLAAGVPVVGLRPAFYLGNLSAPFTAPAVLDAGELRYPLPAGRALPWISVEDQARVVVAALDRPDLAGRVLPIGVRATGAELAAAVATAVGRDVTYRALTPAEFTAVLTPFAGPEAAAAVAAAYRLEGERPDALGLDADPAPAHDELLVPPTPLADWAGTQDWAGAAAIARLVTA